MTLLNLTSENSAIKQFKDFLLERCEPTIKEEENKTKLSAILSSKVGWLISERLINMPPQISTPMLKMLIEEISWAIEDVLIQLLLKFIIIFRMSRLM